MNFSAALFRAMEVYLFKYFLINCTLLIQVDAIAANISAIAVR